MLDIRHISSKRNSSRKTSIGIPLALFPHHLLLIPSVHSPRTKSHSFASHAAITDSLPTHRTPSASHSSLFYFQPLKQKHHSTKNSLTNGQCKLDPVLNFSSKRQCLCPRSCRYQNCMYQSLTFIILATSQWLSSTHSS